MHHSLFLSFLRMVHQLSCIKKISYRSERIHNSNIGTRIKCDIKGRRKFIHTPFFEHRASSDQGTLHPCPIIIIQNSKPVELTGRITRLYLFFFHKIIFAGEFMYHKLMRFKAPSSSQSPTNSFSSFPIQ